MNGAALTNPLLLPKNKGPFLKSIFQYFRGKRCPTMQKDLTLGAEADVGQNWWRRELLAFTVLIRVTLSKLHVKILLN